MNSGTIQALIEIYTQAFQQLHVNVAPEDLEELAVTVHKAMTVQSRNYHSIEHVLGFRDPNNPIQTLAALYHDIVYYQVDMGYSSDIEQVIAPYIHKDGEQLYVSCDIAPRDRLFYLTLDVFGFQPCQALLPAAGLNEFLSALFMNKKLEGILSERDLLCMSLCVEATIPFRGKNERGETHFDVLEQRALAINERLGLGMSHADIEDGVRVAVRFANQDVENFSDADPASFLDGTWKLLPETNAALRYGIYTVRQYRQALEKMERFLVRLNAETVFHDYRGEPGAETFQMWVAIAEQNIRTACEYLKIKLLTAAVLEALAEISGGDVPLSLFMGDIPRMEGERVKRIEDFLPEPEISHLIDVDSTLFRLLESGRANDPGFDLKNAPLSLFIYKSIDPSKADEKLSMARSMFRGELPHEDFLRACRTPVIAAVARAAAAMVPTRREKLLEFARVQPQ